MCNIYSYIQYMNIYIIYMYIHFAYIFYIIYIYIHMHKYSILDIYIYIYHVYRFSQIRQGIKISFLTILQFSLDRPVHLLLFAVIRRYDCRYLPLSFLLFAAILRYHCRYHRRYHRR